jgi:hypothetical protein
LPSIVATAASPLVIPTGEAGSAILAHN